MLLKLKTKPTVEPIGLDEAKLHCRIDHDAEDQLINNLIAAAREFTEQLCGPLITQTWEQYEDSWPSGAKLIIGKPRLLTVPTGVGEGIIYTDINGVGATLSAASYTVDTVNEHRPGVVLLEGYSWPTVSLYAANPIKITFTCGYGAAGTAVPPAIRQAMLLLIGHWYEERQIASIGHMISSMPFAVNALLANYRYW